ncbi:hypothetical protein TGME49_312470 [Toxoplasma gondii ME49]|uniref:Transmembrane protein n=10 Tax=Toxoplasma gondii TaxID=5811 RepID=S7W1Q6_TOXGG|nr:hypothetical protein TGME49_312470 [Toxoplasma gondii ME49]EPR61024.1 hypothetical protein TGGT1_312470 [Toxoplasma gondii GT1]ESS35031.1 putative transmembrane protein [Toxoplasma gondii VEG]KAF4639401.1 hypothetical protein TGRH88_051730 [Toxoplasma gondii]KFG44168.1 putative transmembrane protein [Toxoplasma gondii GAB2-2007-GAL-DOM2]KFG56025.1 putative transmembrane protein [Toxoplasma gondii FOU]KFG66012.1 putative transmembrane protein [Toxoplasma gondii RUB]KYF48159.1 hypothetical |eukprot:XP_018635475.1 hypothetical protein TGME49_312470 [Toxoplasma gondii ME49]
MEANSSSSSLPSVQKFFSDIRTACREAVAVNQVLQMLVDEMNSGGELMTMDQLKAAADYGKDIRPQVAGLATGTAAALAIKATGAFKNSPVWKPAAVVLPAWFAGFALFRLYSNFNFVRISMRDGDSKLARQLRAAYKKAAPPGSTTLENS